MTPKQVQFQQQIYELSLREQRAKTEKAELELELARVQLEAARAFVRSSRQYISWEPQ